MSTPLAIGPVSEADFDAIAALWERCGLTRPWNDARADIAQAWQRANSDILAGRASDGTIIATAMVGHDGHRGWVYYLSVDPAAQKHGHGRAMMRAAEDWLRERGIEKLMLMVRPENEAVHAFYKSIGYEAQPRTIYARWLDGRPMTP
jgi:ribosomal protein S18 acetylase RimI-like enzyme